MADEKRVDTPDVEGLAGTLGPDERAMAENAEELFARLAEEAAQAGSGLGLGAMTQGDGEPALSEPRQRP
ncbi:MAG: hypothetical protein C4289_11730, partial [Chloroflexota bacterium]